MPDDRLGDLGRARSAADRLAELDRREPEPDTPRPPPRRPLGGRYTWVVGVAAVIVIVVAGVNSLPNAGRGIRGPEPGERIPAFAAPSATGPLDADANIKQSGSDEGLSENRTPACEVRMPGVVNVCDLRRRPLVLTLIVPGVPACEDQLDGIERVRRSFPRVAFAAVVSGRPKATVRKLVEEHRWGFPVAVDRDNAVFNLYRAALCPTTVFAYRGGIVRETRIKPLSDSALRIAVRGIERRP